MLDDNQSKCKMRCCLLICSFETDSLFVLEIGVLSTGFGLFFTLFGVLLFFDRGLLAIGNVSQTHLIGELE